jgi:hypothetical protein
MIDVALAYVRQVLDRYLAAKLNSEGGNVVLSSLSNTDSSLVEKNRNKIVITLVNLEYETSKQFYGGYRKDGDQFSQVYPAVHFNLDILVAASFDDYGEALKQLTLVIEFFQGNVVFNRSNNPDMPQGLEALKFEIENSPSTQTHNLWTALSTSYLPSIIYKIRHVSVQAGQVQGASAAIQGISGTALP